MANRIVWTEERLNEASRLWDQGMSASKIAELVGVTRGSMSGTACMHRDLFPGRARAREQAITIKEEPRAVEPVKRPPSKRVHSFGIRAVERHHVSGEVHSMPRVSILNGKEG